MNASRLELRKIIAFKFQDKLRHFVFDLLLYHEVVCSVVFKSSPEGDKNSLTAFYRFPNKTDLCSTQYKRFCTCQLVPTRARGMMTTRELTQSLQ